MSLILLPFRLVILSVLTPLRVARLPLRLFGFRGTLALGLGVGIGLAVAPRTGVETRRILMERWNELQGVTPEGSEPGAYASAPATPPPGSPQGGSPAAG